MPKQSRTERAKRAVRAALAGQGKTQTWLAYRLSVDEAVLSKVLSGYRKPSKPLADGILRLTGVDVLALLEPSEEPEVVR